MQITKKLQTCTKHRDPGIFFRSLRSKDLLLSQNLLVNYDPGKRTRQNFRFAPKGLRANSNIPTYSNVYTHMINSHAYVSSFRNSVLVRFPDSKGGKKREEKFVEASQQAIKKSRPCVPLSRDYLGVSFVKQTLSKLSISLLPISFQN